MQALDIKAMGRGSRQMCRGDKFGFPRTKAKQFKRVSGFKTGDIKGEPHQTDQPIEPVTLNPYGSTHLRISAFRIAKNNSEDV